jgi:uncharacterized protein (DUF111 family)
LRLVLGVRELSGDDRLASSAAASTSGYVVVSATVDDMTGELAAHAIEALLRSGALDAWAAPVTMKKGRPGLVLSALTSAENAQTIATAMLSETTSIGVRITSAGRVERPRRTITVSTPFGDVRCKVSEGPYGPPQSKPEYEDCARLATQAGVPVREVIRAALVSLASSLP